MTTQYPESQTNLPETGCMLAYHQSATNPQNTTANTEIVIPTPIGQLDSTLLDTGGKPAAIILCLAIFLFALSKYNESLLRGCYRNGGKK